MTSVVLDKSFNPFWESARNYLKFVRDGIFEHATWKADLVKGSGCSVSMSFSIFQRNRWMHVLVVYSRVSVSVGGL